MIKNVHLGFFINEYNKDPIYFDLATFKDVDELDQFMEYFYNNNEKIRKLFDQDISEYAIDNIEQFRKVEKITNNNFRGRISAYYYNKLGKIEFLDLPKPNKKPIRDYRRISDCNKCIKYLHEVFEDAVKRINEKFKNTKYGPPKGIFVHYIAEKLHQSGYDISQNEVYYLVKFYNNQSEKNKRDCLTLIRANIKSYYEKLEIERREKEFEEDKKLAQEIVLPKEEKLSINDEPEKKDNKKEVEHSKPSEDLEYAVERTNATGDYDNLFLYHDLDELDRFTNALKKGRR